MSTNWQIFIDESGDFDEPGDVRVVAGVVLPAPPHGTENSALKQKLDAALPDLPYPPHAAHLNLALYRTALGSNAVTDQTAIAALGSVDSSSARGFLESCERGRLPGFDLIRTCGDLLRYADRAVFDELEKRARTDVRNVREVFASVGREFGGKAFVVAAADPVGFPPLADRVEPGTLVRDAYLKLLEAAFERLLLLEAASLSGGLQIWATVARRNVMVAGYPPFSLRVADVGTVIRAAEAALSGIDRSGVRVVPLIPPAYDQLVPPGVVLADFVSNRLRRALKTSSKRDWKEVASSATALFVLPIERAVGASALPSLASDGPARTAIHDALDRKKSNFESIRHRWAREQAETWVRFVSEEVLR